MLQNYLKIAIRNLRRNKLYSFINIAGLAVGIAVALLILLYVQYEFSYDRFNTKADRIYRVNFHIKASNTLNMAYAPMPLTPLLKSNFPGIKEVGRLQDLGDYLGTLVSYKSRHFYEKKLYYADPSIFKIFTIHIIEGNSATGLQRPNTVFISESMARKYFGNENPVSKTLKINNAKKFEVTGVYKDLPPNSHIHFNLLASWASTSRKTDSNWYSGAFTYVLLKKGTKAATIEKQLPIIVKKNVGDQFNGAKLTFTLMSLLDIHLHSHLPEPQPQGDVRIVYLFAGIALLILIIACFNYVNMTTARSVERAKETGVRKVVGASRPQLIRQFFCETIILNLVALLLAIVLVELCLPWFNQLVHRQISVQYLNFTSVLILFAGVLLIVSLLSGGYPALFLSSFRPAEILKGQMINQSGIGIRKGLVIFQFFISMALIVFTIILQKQMDYIQSHRMGFGNSLVLRIKRHGTLAKDYLSFKSELLANSQIRSVTTTRFAPGYAGALKGFDPNDIEGVHEQMVVPLFQGDEDFVKTFDLNIVKGRDFSIGHPTDPDRSVLVNEAAVRKFGWRHPIGKQIKLYGQNRRVIGVVANFHYQSLKELVTPAIIYWNTVPQKNIYVKISSGNLPQTLEFIRKDWHSFVPARPLDYTFLNDDFAAMYRSDYLLGRIFKAFAFLAIFIACLGLFGLAAFSAEQRTKEIGIRKVLGASVTGIVALLSKDFLKLVGIGFLIAVPIAWYTMNRWLQNFAYHVNIGVWTFALAGSLAMVIALLTVSWQAVRAALMNPVESLRNE